MDKIPGLISSESDWFQTEMEKIRPLLENKARGILKNPDNQKEALQEGYLDGWKGHQSFRGEGSFSGWLYSVVVRALFRKRRKELGRGEVPLVNEGAFMGQSGPHEEEKWLTCFEVGKTLGLLPKEMREILTLYYLEDLPIKQIAQKLALKESHVKVLLYRAREKFRKVHERNQNMGEKK